MKKTDPVPTLRLALWRATFQAMRLAATNTTLVPTDFTSASDLALVTVALIYQKVWPAPT